MLLLQLALSHAPVLMETEQQGRWPRIRVQHHPTRGGGMCTMQRFPAEIHLCTGGPLNGFGIYFWTSLSGVVFVKPLSVHAVWLTHCNDRILHREFADVLECVKGPKAKVVAVTSAERAEAVNSKEKPGFFDSITKVF